MEPELVTDWLIAALCDCRKDRVRRRPRLRIVRRCSWRSQASCRGLAPSGSQTAPLCTPVDPSPGAFVQPCPRISLRTFP